MLPFKDNTGSPGAPKSARMEQRTKPHVKVEIDHAAALLGVDETAFVTSAAYERARQVIADHQRTVLVSEDYAAFMAALDAPPAPSRALKQAVRRHRGMVRKRG